MPPTAVENRCVRCGALVPRGACPRCGDLPPLTERTIRGGPPGALLKGLAGPFRALGFLNAHPRLWSWVVIPLVVNCVLFVAISVVLIMYLGDWLPDLEEPWSAWIDWLRVGLGWTLVWLARALATLTAFVATLVLAGIVNAPFYDKLSEATEATALGNKDPGRGWPALAGDIARSLRAAISLAVRQALVMGVLFVLSFTGVGAVLFAVAGFYYVGLAQIDVTLSRKLYRGGQRTRWGWKRFTLVLGLGLPVSFLPPLQPFGIVGATLAYLDEPRKA